MVTQGVDYSAGYTAAVPAALIAHGYAFVMRYLSHPGNPKNISSVELTALHAAGLGVGIVFETTAERALHGEAGGKQDAQDAREQLAALGLTRAAVYFAVDFDPTAHQLDTVLHYIRGAAGVLGKERTGVYGGIAVIDKCAAADACTFFWQTSAWSHGKISPAAHLYQHIYDETIVGVQVDINDLLHPDAGITWPTGKPTG
ncbi:MAG TPA: DUF1906 domain-containing protein [Sporichthyaceae bacterium]